MKPVDGKEWAWAADGDAIAAHYETREARIKATCAPEHRTGKWIPDIRAASPDFLTQCERDGLSAGADEIAEIRREGKAGEERIIIIKGMPQDSLAAAAGAAQTQAEALADVLQGKEQDRARTGENEHQMDLEKAGFLAGAGSPEAGARLGRISRLLPDLRTSSWLAIAAGIVLGAFTLWTTPAWIGFWFVIAIVTAQIVSITEAGCPKGRRRRDRR